MVARRGRTNFDALRASPSGIVDDGAVFGWVTDSVLPDGRWQLAPRVLVDQLATLGEPAPLVLIPRRQARHLNSQLTDIDAPAGASDRPDVLVHPRDATDAGVIDGDEVVLTSASGSVRARAVVGEAITRGVVSLPHGFDGAGIGYLTTGRDHIDPLTGMVLQSALPVMLERSAGRLDG